MPAILMVMVSPSFLDGENMSRFIEFVSVLFLCSLIVVVPVAVAVSSSNYTKVGVLSYTLTNSKQLALHF